MISCLLALSMCAQPIGRAMYGVLFEQCPAWLVVCGCLRRVGARCPGVSCCVPQPALTYTAGLGDRPPTLCYNAYKDFHIRAGAFVGKESERDMIYELLLENFMYPNIAANLPRAFPRYKLSDEDYTLKLFINEAKRNNDTRAYR